MEFVTGKHIPRRTFLRGMGATVALPFLDAMVPAGRVWTPAGADRPRLIAIEMVHGAAGCNEWGAKQNLWSPAGVGHDFDLGPTALSSLEPYRDSLTIVSNTDCRMAEAYAPKEIGGDHFRSSAVFLTQAHPKQTQGSDLYAGTSLDQLHAQRFGQDTPMPSMQLCIESMDKGGGCDYNYSCAYTDSISWASPTEPLPMIRSPRVAFDLLFGAGGTPEERALRRRTHQSILDWIAAEAAQLKRELGLVDRQRMDRYLEGVREIERRIEAIEARNNSGEPRQLPEAPPDVPDSFEEHMKLLFDLQVLAFEMDMTRVIAFKTGRDASNRTFPQSGSDKAFHPASHHGDKHEGILEFNMISRYRLRMLDYFLQRLQDTVDGDSSLLDQTLIVWGSPMGDANLHNHRRCPLILLGRANGRLDGNLHLRAPDGTPMANVFLSLLHELGHQDQAFGDSTGEFPLRLPSSTV